MASINYKQGARMTQALTSTSRQAATHTQAASINYKRLFLLWVIAQQYINIFALLWSLIVPEVSRGLMGLVQRDFHASPEVLIIPYAVSLGVTLRGAKPRYGMVLALSGQGVTAFFALLYAIHGDISLSQFGGHGGLFALNLAGVIAMTQYASPRPRRWTMQTALIPLIAVIMILYALGIASRPDMGVSRFIDEQFRSPLNDILLLWFAIGAGYIVLNHIHPSKLFVALLPMIVYAFMAAAFLGSDNSISISGIFVHLMLMFTMMIVVMLQTREYARQSRNGA